MVVRRRMTVSSSHGEKVGKPTDANDFDFPSNLIKFPDGISESTTDRPDAAEVGQVRR